MVVVCSLLGKFFSAMQNVTIVMQTSELFHTPVRGIVVALCSTAGKVGGILAPVVATLVSHLESKQLEAPEPDSVAKPRLTVDPLNRGSMAPFVSI